MINFRRLIPSDMGIGSGGKIISGSGEQRNFIEKFMGFELAFVT